MDRLISEQAVIDRLSHWYSDMLETNKEQEDLIEVIKAIPSAEPYKGMTKGEVIMAVKGEAKVIDNKGYKLITFTDDWWNSPYEPQERSDKE